MFKAYFLALATLFSTSLFAMEPLRAIDQNDPAYARYNAVVNMDQKLVNERLIETYFEIDHQEYRLAGRLVPLADGGRLNPLNLVLSVNGNLYYIDAILNSVDAVGIRRRWRNNPEPGIYLRIEGRRVNEDDGTIERVTLWTKISTPEGRVLPKLKLLEGNYDIAELPPPEPLLPKAVSRPRPLLQKTSDVLQNLQSAEPALPNSL